jgi:prolyl-tRNA synthetase
MAGVYSLLPLGLRTVNNITQIVREEMNAVGGIEMQSAALQSEEVWAQTRWSDEIVDNWFKTKLKNDTELGLAVTHEPALTKVMKDFIRSYRDLPAYPYQFQTKFRNELRAKSGIMRCREFIMKDLYSFSKNKEDHEVFYEKAKQAYINVYERLGLGDTTYLTFASGGMFSKFSHEFQTITEAGEDIIYVHEGKKIAINKEVYTDEILAELGVDRLELIEKKAVEVGNIFTLGTRFSDALGLTFDNESGEKEAVFMGSYGIGPGRVMGTIVETLSDDRGIIWPESVAPFTIHLIQLGKTDNTLENADRIYHDLQQRGFEVLFDDRNVSTGEKLADADLIGIPFRVIISDKSIEKGGFEVKKRNEDDSKIVNYEDFLEMLPMSVVTISH